MIALRVKIAIQGGVMATTILLNSRSRELAKYAALIAFIVTFAGCGPRSTGKNEGLLGYAVKVEGIDRAFTIYPSAPTLAQTPTPTPTSTPTPTPRILYRFNNGKDLFITASQSEGSGAGYRLEGIAFAVYPTQIPGTHALYRCNSGDGDHFVSASTNCEGTRLEGLHGYVYSNPQPKSQAIYRFRHSTGGDHLETTRLQEGYDSGLVYEGILGYGVPY